MFLLRFQLGNSACCIDAESIEEIVPTVPLTADCLLPQYILGSFIFRGAEVPVVDLSHYVIGSFSRNVLSTRYVIVNLKSSILGYSRMAFKAEKMTDVLEVDSGCFYRIETRGMPWKEAAYKVIKEEKRVFLYRYS